MNAALTLESAKAGRMGLLFAAVLTVVVFEGALRKWVSPAFTGPLVVVRDALVVYAVGWAVGTRRLRLTGLGAQVLTMWSFVVVAWGLLQLIANESPAPVLVVGLRFWLLYLWFAYTVGVVFTPADFRFAARYWLWLLLVMTPLVVVQYTLPPGAFLNKQVGGDESTVFRVTADIVRTTGTFSFTAGYTTFIAVATPLALALLVPAHTMVQGTWRRLLYFGLLAVGTIVSGSRAAYVFFAVMLVVLGGSYFVFARGARKGAVLLVAPIAAGLLAGVASFFSGATEAMRERFESAAEVEDFAERVYTIFLGESGVLDTVTFVGKGLGMGSNLAGALATGERTFLLAETETARTLLEGGALGVLSLLIKIGVVAAGLRAAVAILRKTGEPLPYLLWVTTGFALFSWSIIGQLTINALGFMLFGLAVASLRLYDRRA